MAVDIYKKHHAAIKRHETQTHMRLKYNNKPTTRTTTHRGSE